MHTENKVVNKEKAATKLNIVKSMKLKGSKFAPTTENETDNITVTHRGGLGRRDTGQMPGGPVGFGPLGPV